MNKSIIALLMFLLLSGCGSGTNKDSLKQEILDLHQNFIDAHLNKDVNFIVNSISENYFSVARGEVTRRTKADMRETMEEYLYNSEFSEYRDVEPPIVSISDDGSMAWSVFNVKVTGKRKNDDGSETDFEFTCVWLSIFERRNSKWIMVNDVSTFK